MAKRFRSRASESDIFVVARDRKNNSSRASGERAGLTRASRSFLLAHLMSSSAQERLVARPRSVRLTERDGYYYGRGTADEKQWPRSRGQRSAELEGFVPTEIDYRTPRTKKRSRQCVAVCSEPQGESHAVVSTNEEAPATRRTSRSSIWRPAERSPRTSPCSRRTMWSFSVPARTTPSHPSPLVSSRPAISHQAQRRHAVVLH